MRFLSICPVLVALAACGSTKPDSQAKADTLDADCNAAITRGKGAGLTKWFDTAHGYAVFPSVGKAGFIVGGAHGKGQVYEQGKVVGFSAITQGSVGLQIGAQGFTEIVFFKDKTAFDAFKEGNYELDAEATAVAADKGASAQSDYSKGVAVFVFGEGGLMAGAAVGGQRFKYEPKS
jgi:lipid-binding SYLF domain-containing protein